MRISGRRMRKPWHYRRDCDSWRTACQQQGHENDAENFRPCAPLSASRPASVADDDIRKHFRDSSPLLPTSNFFTGCSHTIISPQITQDQVWGVGLHVCNVWGRVEEVVDVLRCRGDACRVGSLFLCIYFRGGGPSPRPGGTSVKCVTITKLKSTS